MHFVMARRIASFGHFQCRNMMRRQARQRRQATPTRSALKLLHERREVRDFPMLRELSVVDSVKLKAIASILLPVALRQ